VKLVLADIDDDRLKSILRDISSAGHSVIAVTADVTCQPDVDNVIAQAVDTFGELNIFVNNAGVTAIGPLIETNDKTWDWVMDVNAKAAFLCCTAAARQMISQAKGGRIIINGSSAGSKAPERGVPMGVYSASKHAVVGFTKQLGIELAAYGILVNCVCAGVVATPMWDRIDLEASRKAGVEAGSIKAAAIERIPLGRVQTPEDVANVIAFLASDDAAYMTASTVNVTGGLWAA
jgi:NAD(P)-dependent dehydrogenase (short-subunit alcohol dehydrogenase family)